MSPRTLRQAADAADAARFVGRSAELAAVNELLEPTTPTRLLYVHGPGGIGKSTLLRELVRHLRDGAGHSVVHVSARDLASDPERAADDLIAAAPSRRNGELVCFVIDDADSLDNPDRKRPQLNTLLDRLRDRLLDRLDDSSRLIVAGRRAPGPSWRQHGLDAITIDLPLPVLNDDEARQLLRDRQVDESRLDTLVEWAQGSPLALTVAANDVTGRPPLHDPAGLERRLTTWLTGEPLLDAPPDLLEVAALARVVDARLLAAALPGRGTRDGLARLAALPVVERVGDAVAVHAVLAAAIRARLRATEPERENALVRRIAVHLANRARLGDLGALLRLTELIENRQVRATIGQHPGDTFHADTPTPGELEEFGRAEGFARSTEWPQVLAWFERWPSQVRVVRRVTGAPVQLGCYVRVSDLTPGDRLSDGLLAAAAAVGVDPARTFAGVVLFADVDEHTALTATRLGSGAFMLQRGVGDLQTMLFHFPTPNRAPVVPTPLMHPTPPGLPLPVAVSDFRPLGAIGTVEAMVLAERGFRPERDRSSLLLTDTDPARIEALTAVLGEVFSSSENDLRMRRAIELVHLGRRHSEQQCRETLHVSRRTWYRLLRSARERVLTS
ncbi:ATP-binding protein [Aestuariimicrobium soli]|uniref:ATP-binding protein n=1 Tax=Aestuariimicrobium soli TaxID=2035834 RepID=UPI003EBEDB01